jgi:hypothetical protein
MANEVSDDTRSLVEKYLETDSELAHIAKESASIELPDDIPISLSKEDQMDAYKEAKRFMFLRTVILAITFSTTLVCLLALALLAAAYFIR